VRIGRVVPKIWSRTDKHTHIDRQKDTRGGGIIIVVTRSAEYAVNVTNSQVSVRPSVPAIGSSRCPVSLLLRSGAGANYRSMAAGRVNFDSTVRRSNILVWIMSSSTSEGENCGIACRLYVNLRKKYPQQRCLLSKTIVGLSLAADASRCRHLVISRFTSFSSMENNILGSLLTDAAAASSWVTPPACNAAVATGGDDDDDDDRYAKMEPRATPLHCN